MPEDFGYVNARIRGMSAKLLSQDFYASVLGASDFDAFTSALGQTPYGPDLEEVGASVSGLEVVDRAVARNFHRTTRSILAFADGTPERLVSILLRRFDLDDLKTVARAHHSGRASESGGDALLGVGEVDRGTLERMMAAADLAGAAQVLGVTGHPLSRAFARAARQYAQDGDLFAFELALDQAHFASLLESAEEAGADDDFVRYLRKEIDAANLRTALKLRGRRSDVDRFYLRGGKELSQDAFRQLVSGGDLGLLQDTSFAEVAEAEDAAAVEGVVRAVLDRAARRVAQRDPLGIGVALRYLRRKEAETARLRLLARGTFYGVPRDRLEKEMHGA